MAACSLALASAGVAAEELKWYTDWNAAREAARKSDKPIMIDFYTDWCGWCKKLDRDTYSDKRVQALLKQGFVPLKLNAEKNGRQLAQKYGVRGYPTILFVNADGKVLHRIGGYKPPEPFVRDLEQVRQRWELGQQRPRLEKRVAANPDDGEAHAKLALIFSASAKQIDDAIRHFRAAVKAGYRGDALGQAANNIGDHYWSKGQADKALPWFRQADQLARKSRTRAYARYSIMACHYRSRQLDKAKDAARELLKLPDVPEEYRKAAQWVLKQKAAAGKPKTP